MGYILNNKINNTLVCAIREIMRGWKVDYSFVSIDGNTHVSVSNDLIGETRLWLLIEYVPDKVTRVTFCCSYLNIFIFQDEREFIDKGEMLDYLRNINRISSETIDTALVEMNKTFNHCLKGALKY